MTSRIALAAIGLVFLAGCGMLAGRPHPVSHHVLEVPAAPFPITGAPATGVLLLRETEAPGIHQSLNLVYSRSPGTLSHYQYARWSEIPARRFDTLLRQRLDAGGRFQAVAAVGAGVRGDFQLNARLLDFHHDAAQPPGFARVALEVELVDRRDARLIARELLWSQAPAPSHDALGAATALGRASGQVLDELVNWLDRVRQRDAR